MSKQRATTDRSPQTPYKMKRGQWEGINLHPDTTNVIIGDSNTSRMTDICTPNTQVISYAGATISDFYHQVATVEVHPDVKALIFHMGYNDLAPPRQLGDSEPSTKVDAAEEILPDLMELLAATFPNATRTVLLLHPHSEFCGGSWLSGKPLQRLNQALFVQGNKIGVPSAEIPSTDAHWLRDDKIHLNKLGDGFYSAEMDTLLQHC